MFIRPTTHHPIQQDLGKDNALQRGVDQRKGLLQQDSTQVLAKSEKFSEESARRLFNDQVIAALNDALSGSIPKDIYSLDPVDFQPEKVAERILGFVGQAIAQLATDDKTARNEKLQQARQGIEKGFADAKKMLEELDVYSGKIQENAEQTYSLLQDGLDRFSQSIAQSLPLSGVTRAQQTSTELAMQASFSKRQSIEIEVKTRDGDTVKIQIHKNQEASESGVIKQDGQSSLFARVQQTSASAGFTYTINGNIDEEELTAIDDLVGEIGQVADEFFQGDVQAAMDQAFDIGYDARELASFAVHLHENQQTRVSTAYQQVQTLGSEKPYLGAMENVAKQFKDFFDHFRQSLEHVQASDFFQDPVGNFNDLFSGLARMDDSKSSLISHLEERAGKSLEEVTRDLSNLLKSSMNTE